MGQKDILQRSVDVGRDVSQKTQDRVEALLADLVKLSEQQAEQARSALNDLVDRSRTTSEQLVDAVDRELRAQVANLGLATQADIRRLERKIESLGGTATPKKATTRKSSAKKATTKKASTGKATTKKTPAGKAAAKKAAGS